MFYAKNISNPNFELSNKEQPIKPDTTVNPDSLPMDSSLITEFYNWLNIFQEFCKRHCPKAWILWNKGESRFPVLPTVQDLANFMEDRNLHKDGTIYSVEYFFSAIHEWAVDNIINSTANASHFNTLGWLDSMIRRSASKVPLLHNKLQSVAYYNVTKLKLTIINHYRQLTDLQKNEGWKSISLLGN